MKYRLIATGLNWLAKRLDGHKTRIGAGLKVVGVVLMGANELFMVLQAMFPETGPPNVTREVAAAASAVVYGFGSGVQGVGVAHKLEKEAEQIDRIIHKPGEGHPYDGA